MTGIYNIYLVVDPEGFGYVGASSRPADVRWRQHFGCPPRPWPGREKAAICDAIKRHGRDGFTFHHLASAIGPDNAAEVEGALIAQYGTRSPNGYNRQTRGGNGLRGRNFSAANDPQSKAEAA